MITTVHTAGISTGYGNAGSVNSNGINGTNTVDLVESNIAGYGLGGPKLNKFEEYNYSWSHSSSQFDVDYTESETITNTYGCPRTGYIVAGGGGGGYGGTGCIGGTVTLAVMMAYYNSGTRYSYTRWYNNMYIDFPIGGGGGGYGYQSNPTAEMYSLNGRGYYLQELGDEQSNQYQYGGKPGICIIQYYTRS